LVFIFGDFIVPCIDCEYYIPYEMFPYVGFCALKGSITFADNSCERASPLDIHQVIREKGRIYCLTCRTWVFEDELDEHITHRLHVHVYDDDFVHEEAHAVD